VKRAYDATHKTAATPAANGETRVEQAGARDRAAGEVEAWRKKAEADGSLFDLKKDSVKVIATTIAGNVSLHGAAKGARRRDQSNQGCAKAGWLSRRRLSRSAAGAR
jgi:hypothetical protein